MKQFKADQDKGGEWFVYDNESCSCHAGPMDEHEAASMAIELNQKKNQASTSLDSYKARAISAEQICLNQSKQLEQIGSIINYPEAWDTMCYDSLQSAIEHLIQCGEMAKP